MKKIGILMLCLLLGGCLSIFHRTDTDKYDGASATFEGNGRTTTMATSQPAATPTTAPAAIAPCPVIQQVVPNVGEIFILDFGGRKYEAMKKTDGKVYIIEEIR